MGKLIVFEGIDSSGKETQARLLTGYLRDKIDATVATFSFPTTDTIFGREIQEWLHGRRQQYNQYVVNLLYTQDRMMHKETLERCIKDYDYTIVDRYFYSNWVYGSFKENISRLWLQSIDQPLPKPNMVFLLCIDGELSMKRSGLDADIHESDRVFLDKCNLEYQRLGNMLGWTILDGDDLPEKIHYRICSQFVTVTPSSASS